jgi:hypothetical protein
MPDEALVEATLHELDELAQQQAERPTPKIDAKAWRRR